MAALTDFPTSIFKKQDKNRIEKRKEKSFVYICFNSIPICSIEPKTQVGVSHCGLAVRRSTSYFGCPLSLGAGIAQWLEHRTRD